MSFLLGLDFVCLFVCLVVRYFSCLLYVCLSVCLFSCLFSCFFVSLFVRFFACLLRPYFIDSDSGGTREKGECGNVGIRERLRRGVMA